MVGLYSTDHEANRFSDPLFGESPSPFLYNCIPVHALADLRKYVCYQNSSAAKHRLPMADSGVHDNVSSQNFRSHGCLPGTISSISSPPPKNICVAHPLVRSPPPPPCPSRLQSRSSAKLLVATDYWLPSDSCGKCRPAGPTTVAEAPPGRFSPRNHGGQLEVDSWKPDTGGKGRKKGAPTGRSASEANLTGGGL